MSPRTHVDVLFAVHAQGQAFALAVLGQVGDAVGDGIAGAVVDDLFAIQRDFNALGAIGAEDGARQLRPPGAHQAGEADDFAAAHFDMIDVELFAFDVVHAEQHVADFALVHGVFVLQFAADHHFDQFVQRLVGKTEGFADLLPVAQNGDHVGDFLELLHAVGRCR